MIRLKYRSRRIEQLQASASLAMRHQPDPKRVIFNDHFSLEGHCLNSGLYVHLMKAITVYQ
jgi:hypothetical protein